MLRLTFIMLFVCALSQAQAQVLEKYHSAEQIQTTEQAWLQAHPNVRVFSRAYFNSLPFTEQLTHEAYGYIIIFNGPSLLQRDILDYEARASQIVTRSYSDYKEFLYLSDPQGFAARQQAGMPNLSGSTAVPTNVANPNPNATQLTQAQFNALTDEKKRYINAHPADYIIIQD